MIAMLLALAAHNTTYAPIIGAQYNWTLSNQGSICTAVEHHNVRDLIDPTVTIAFDALHPNYGTVIVIAIDAPATRGADIGRGAMYGRRDDGSYVSLGVTVDFRQTGSVLVEQRAQGSIALIDSIAHYNSWHFVPEDGGSPLDINFVDNVQMATGFTYCREHHAKL